MNLPQVTIYIDGACLGNPGPGGWGAILIYGEHRKEINGGEPFTTNNRMELKAAIEALRALKFPCLVTVYTDSAYLVNGMTRWLPLWKKRHWRKGEGGEIENRDLWVELAQLAQTHTITWKWVKGHADDPLNRYVHHLAHQGIPTSTPPSSSNDP